MCLLPRAILVVVVKLRPITALIFHWFLEQHMYRKRLLGPLHPTLARRWGSPSSSVASHPEVRILLLPPGSGPSF
ncbi:unnamed protein product [Caretta caretta]